MSDYFCSKCQAPASLGDAGVERSCECNAPVTMDMGSVSMIGKSSFGVKEPITLADKIKICLIDLIKLVQRGDS